MLQPHQIIAEYNTAIPEAEREKLKDGAFEDVLRAAQVCIWPLIGLQYPLFTLFLAVISCTAVYHTGGNRHLPMGCTCHPP
jgi:hypothetical protein